MKPHSELKCSRVANEKTNKCKVVKSLKPLVNFKFYLDIEKHNISLKIESKIRELGGSIEFFLTKDVTHFITDKVLEKDTGLNSPQTPATPQTPLSNYSEVGSNASVGNDPKNGVKIRSRADAMLQRARKGTTESESTRPSILTKSPTQVAKNWGTPIWHTEYALKYFEKVFAAIKDHYKGNFESRTKQKIGNAKVLKGNFIKIESFQKHYRPYYQFLKGTWPTINLKFSNSIGAFYNSNDRPEQDNNTIKANERKLAAQSTKSKDTSMTRKNRSKHIRVQQNSRISSEKQCGFCEICRVEYDVLTIHLKTDEHVNFAKNDTNFIELDSLIKSSANVNKFLSINKTLFNSSECEIFPKRSKRNATNRMLHSSQSEGNDLKSPIVEDKKSLSDTRHTRQSINALPGRETTIEVGAVVRARRESVRKINYAEPGEDEENSDDAIFQIQRKQKVNKRQGVKVKSEDSDIKPKRPISVLYKVVESKPDLLEKKEPLTESNSEQQPTSLIVKFKKIRQAELNVLNGEAENFMFPRKVSSDLSTDVERQTTSDSRTQSSELSSSEKVVVSPKRKYSSMNHCPDDSRESGKRKRCNTSVTVKQERIDQSEKETGNRSQRFQSAPIQSRGRKKLKKKSINNNDAVVENSPPEDGMGEPDTCNLESILKNELGQYKFAFERVPSSEPWYEVFQRQDECQERIFEYYGSTAYRKLPYEMGPLPPLPKNCYCISKKNGSSAPQKSSSSNESGMMIIKEKMTASKPKVTNPKNLKLKINRKEKPISKAASLLNAEMPRKSPREHPSTLAILSCLIQQKDEIFPDENKTADDEQPTITITKAETRITAVPKEAISMEISPQIGENVKRLRRGEKLLESKKLKTEVEQPKCVTIKPRNSVGRPRKNFGNRTKKPLEFNMNEQKLYEKDNSFVDVNRLKKDIDLYLSQPLTDWDIRETENITSNNAIDYFCNDLQLSDLVYDRIHCNETNTFRTHTNQTIANKLRLYKMFAINKKSKVNKTGWPKKRRVVTRQQNNIRMPNFNGLPSVEISHQFGEKFNNEINISTQSPITPPETDIDDKIECDPNPSIVCRDENTNLTYASDRADNSDIFTVSSDSLDTVLDVGSQIKTEIQKEIIASRKCKVNLSSKLPQDIKIRKSCRISFRKEKKSFLHRKRNIKIELTDIDEANSSSSIDYNTTGKSISLPLQKCSPSKISSPLSPRRLRKPRGRWYRER